MVRLGRWERFLDLLDERCATERLGQVILLDVLDDVEDLPVLSADDDSRHLSSP